MYRKLVLLILPAILLLACSTPASVESLKQDNPPAIIGVCIALSGDALAYGGPQKKGIELAAGEINTNSYLGKGKELKVVMVDGGSSGDTAKVAMTKLINENKLLGLIGPTLSTQAFYAQPVAQAAGIPVMGISNTAPGITEMGNYVFRVSLPESVVILAAIKTAASQLWVKSVAYLWGKDDDYTIAGYKAFGTAVDKYGLRVVSDKTFARGDTNFKSQLTEIAIAKPDALLVSALANEAAGIIIQAREMGYKGTIVGGNGFSSPEVIKQAGTAAEGVLIGTAWNNAGTNPKNLEFISNYQKAYNIKPDQFSAQAYTGALLFANAIRNAEKADPKSVRDALAKTSNFTTPLGAFSFSADREPIHPCTVQIIRNGRYYAY